MSSMDIPQSINDGDASYAVLRCLIRQLIPFSPQVAIRQAQLFHQYVRILQKFQLALQTVPTMPINTEFGMITGGGLANLEWVRPFIDCTTIATFPGLALSTMAYGCISDGLYHQQHQTQLQTFTVPIEEREGEGQQCPHSLEDRTSPVFPSKPCHLLVWDELQHILLDELNRQTPLCNYVHFGLFSNQFTNNDKPSLLPFGEPFFVRFGIQNPFPFQLVLRNLCLSLDQLKLRPGCSPPFFDKFRCSIISELIIPPLATDERQLAETGPNENQHFVELQVLPGPELDHFAVNGIKFDLCSPIHFDDPSDERNNGQSMAENVPSASAFVPFSVRGKRLFRTKEQRMSKQYAVDKRLSTTMCAHSVPLLSFRPIGGDPGFIKAVTQQWHSLEAFCDQIVQIVFEIENVGSDVVEQLRFCTNFAENVSISEPSDSVDSVGRWTQCSAKSVITGFADNPSMSNEFGMGTAAVGQIGKICKNNPLEVGQKIGLRVAIRVLQKPQQAFYFLFLYADRNGRSRQFRFSLRVCPLSRIFEADHRVLNKSIGLSLLNLHCFPINALRNEAATTAPAMTLAKLDLLRLSIKFADGKVRRATVRRVENEPIQLESATEQNLCFYVSEEGTEEEMGQQTNTGPSMPNLAVWTDVWLGKTYVPDFPEWQIDAKGAENEKRAGIVGDAQQQQQGMEGETDDALRMKLLWKASLIRNDGTVTSVFGEHLK